MNTSEKTGAIRYQYMGQDVQYVIRTMQIDGGEVKGRAVFHTSLSGEMRGTPIAFVYDYSTGTLVDGSVSASCENNQAADRS